MESVFWLSDWVLDVHFWHCDGPEIRDVVRLVRVSENRFQTTLFFASSLLKVFEPRWKTTGMLSRLPRRYHDHRISKLVWRIVNRFGNSNRNLIESRMPWRSRLYEFATGNHGVSKHRMDCEKVVCNELSSWFFWLTQKRVHRIEHGALSQRSFCGVMPARNEIGKYDDPKLSRWASKFIWWDQPHDIQCDLMDFRARTAQTKVWAIQTRATFPGSDHILLLIRLIDKTHAAGHPTVRKPTKTFGKSVLELLQTGRAVSLIVLWMMDASVCWSCFYWDEKIDSFTDCTEKFCNVWFSL